MAKQRQDSTAPSTESLLPGSETLPQEPAGSNGKKSRKPGRKPSPFLIALRRVELLIETLPEEVALKVAQHAVFIAEQRIRNAFHASRTPTVPNREVGVTGEPNG